MRTVVVTVVLLAAAGAAGWLLLREEDRVPNPEESAPAARPAALEPPSDPPAFRPDAAPDVLDWPPPPEPPRTGPPPDWQTQRLELQGRGVVTGRDLLEAITATKMLLVKATAADLEALRATEFESLDRRVPLPVTVLRDLLLQAGFEMEVRYPTLYVRKAPRPEPEGPDAPPR